MAACFNCRAYIHLADDTCPYCGSIFRPGTWRTASDLIEPAKGGWGLSPETLRGRWFAGMNLAVPVWVPLATGLLLGCLMHIPVIKVSTPSAVAYIKTLMDGKGLVESERKMVDFELDQILFNDSRYRMVHSGLWHAGVCGFGILGSIHLLLGLVMVRAERRARRTGGPVAPPNPLRR